MIAVGNKSKSVSNPVNVLSTLSSTCSIVVDNICKSFSFIDIVIGPSGVSNRKELELVLVTSSFIVVIVVNDKGDKSLLLSGRIIIVILVDLVILTVTLFEI